MMLYSKRRGRIIRRKNLQNDRRHVKGRRIFVLEYDKLP